MAAIYRSHMCKNEKMKKYVGGKQSFVLLQT